MIKKRSFLAILLLCFFCTSYRDQYTDDLQAISPKREFRAVWIATVDNIDWPSQKNLTPQKQRKEFSDLLDFHKANGLNAVFVQVRAAGDAFYAKSAEPWSEWLTGKQGREPYPFYDPMEFMIDEAHGRGMEFHAWLNLNRLVHKSSLSVSRYNISNIRPEWILEYDGYKLFDFGIPEVRDFITEIVANIVRNYDVDGIHFDDYFYPYAVPGKTLQDEKTYRQYGQEFTNKGEWRRHNVDLLIKQITDAIDKEKPRVKFGISPFGVWRNQRDDARGSNTTGGLTSYDHLYADVRKWLEKGWIDYVVPQVYFSFGFKKVPYANLVDWWKDNAFGRHLYIGHGVYRIGPNDTDKNWNSARELPNQLRYNRGSRVDGSVFFSSRSLKNNVYGVTDSIRNNFYKHMALVPTMPWKDNVPPHSPEAVEAEINEDGELEVIWQTPTAAADGDLPWYYLVYRFEVDERIGNSDPSKIVGAVYKGKTRLVDRTARAGSRYLYYVTAVDRMHNESRPAGPLRIRLQEE